MRQINPRRCGEKVIQFKLNDTGIIELRGKRSTARSARTRTNVTIFCKGDTISLWAGRRPLLPAGRLNTGVKVRVDLSNSSIGIPRPSKRDLGHSSCTSRGYDGALIEDKTTSGCIGSALVSGEVDIILIRRDCCVQEITSSTSPNHIDISLHISVRHPQIAIDQQRILVTCYLAAYYNC